MVTPNVPPAPVVQEPSVNAASVIESVAALIGGQAKVFQFSADAPIVNDDKLYVMQTTTVYPDYEWLTLTSALSEAGIEVVP